MADDGEPKFKRRKVVRRNGEVAEQPSTVGPSTKNGNENGISREQAMNLGLPNRWKFCPKYGKVVFNRFLPMKTPLSEGYDDMLEPEWRFHPQEVFKMQLKGANENAKVKLWINLANTERYYGRNAVTSNGCEYKWMPLRGHNETPSPEETDAFIRTVNEFIRENPNDVIAIHCTHGFNRTGFLIVAFLVQIEEFGVDVAVNEFAEARLKGIYKEDYIRELCKRYDSFYDPDGELPCELPGRPAWEEGPDPSINYEEMMGEVPAGFVQGEALFMDGQVPDCPLVTDVETRNYLQGKVRTMMEPFAKNGKLRNEFPGSQPVSMTVQNVSLLSKERFMVSWKADGMRYLVLINGQDEVYAFDRDNNPFHIPISFPRKDKPKQHVENTLVDSEVIMQKREDGQVRARLLIYDLIIHENNPIGKENYYQRFKAIETYLVKPRHQAICSGALRKENEPLSVDRKGFWLTSVTAKVFERFSHGLGHHSDGLIYQPVDEPYHPGRFDKLLKWKPVDESSIDFKLKIVKKARPMEPVQYVGELYVMNMERPFAEMKATKTLQQYDGKIIECNFKNGQWCFMRERTDKSHPNGLNTANSVMSTIRHPVHQHNLIQYIHQIRFDEDNYPHLIQQSRPPPQQSTQMHTTVL